MVALLTILGTKLGGALVSLIGIGAVLAILKLVLPRFIAGKLLKGIHLALSRSDEPSKALVKAIAKWAEAEIPEGCDLVTKSSSLAEKVVSCSPRLLGPRKDSIAELLAKVLAAADDILKQESQKP